MHDAMGMRVGKGVAHLDENAQQPVEVVDATSLLIAEDLLFKNVTERLALELFHGEVKTTFDILADLINGHRVGMLQLGGHSRFAQEP